MTGISNGLQILKPQIILFGAGAILKIPTFILAHKLIPSIDWSLLVIIDSVIMLAVSITMAILNHKAIKTKTREIV